MTAALISVIGPPASGKTTTAGWLADELPARLILEDYAGNPFLHDACLGRRDLALPSQLYFLFTRVSQLGLRTWPPAGRAVCDYGFCQDGVYARASLDGDDLATYRALAEKAAATVKPPDVVVHLDAGEDLLLERIARRGRDFEAAFTGEFIACLRRAYRDIVDHLGCPVIPVDAGREDLLTPPGRKWLLRRIREVMK